MGDFETFLAILDVIFFLIAFYVTKLFLNIEISEFSAIFNPPWSNPNFSPLLKIPKKSNIFNFKIFEVVMSVHVVKIYNRK